jgi:HSP20 family protein
MLTQYRNSHDFPHFSLFDWGSPGRTFGNLRQDLDRLFGVYERSIADPYVNNQENADLRDAGNEIVISVDLPGVSKKDVELSVSGDNVFVRASRTASAPDGYTAHRRERVSYKFEHAWRLPVPVDTQKAEAKLQDGVLTVTLPKSPNAQPKQIPVKAG